MTPVCRHCGLDLAGPYPLGRRRRYVAAGTGSFFCGNGRHHQPKGSRRDRIAIWAVRVTRRWLA